MEPPKKKKKIEENKTQTSLTNFFTKSNSAKSEEHSKEKTDLPKSKPDAPTGLQGPSSFVSEVSGSIRSGDTNCSDPGKSNGEDSSKEKATHANGSPWNADECREVIKTLFDDKHTVHHCYTCNKKDCTSLSKSEVQRILPKKFQHSWLKNDNWWLCYVEGEGMFCLICRKHLMKHHQNQKEIFASSPAVRMKVDAINTHSKSNLHSDAIENELLQKVSYFHRETTKKTETEMSVLEQVFSTAYFLMKSFIANRQFQPMLNFVEKVFKVESLKYFDHKSAGVQTEIFLTLGETVKEEVLRKVKEASAFGILTDEVSDVSVTENLVSFIQYYCHESHKVETSFLSCQNALEHFQSANAEAISTLILEELDDHDGLDLTRFTGFTSDGAAVMVGKTNGVAARLRQVNPTLLNVHCICHRLALACTAASNKLSYINDVETWLRQLWQYFENSPQRMAAYLKMQGQLKSITLDRDSVDKGTRRLKKACRTRWLSMEASVKAVHADYEPLLQTLAQLESKDATASGLLKKIKTVKFLGVIYILKDVLPILGDLSRRFQKGSVNFAAILPAISMTKDRLESLLESEGPLDQLQKDIDSFSNMSSDIRMDKRDGQFLQTLFNNYIEALQENIKNRFANCSEVLAAFSIYDPAAVPENVNELKLYGNENIEVLSDHYFRDNEGKSERLRAQWQGFKYYLRDVMKPNIPATVLKDSNVTATEWCLLKLLENPAIEQLYPDIYYLAEVIACLPVSNAWPERGASSLKALKTRLRNRLGTAMLESLLHITINAPDPTSAEGQEVVKAAVKKWLHKKKRKKLPQAGKRCTKQEVEAEAAQAAVGNNQLENPPQEVVNVAVDIALRKLGLDESSGSESEADDCCY